MAAQAYCRSFRYVWSDDAIVITKLITGQYSVAGLLIFRNIYLVYISSEETHPLGYRPLHKFTSQLQEPNIRILMIG
jgi:hypothetical protein